MIIKFDHISFSCRLDEPTDEIVKGYTQEFIERNLPNIRAKSSFLQDNPAYHDISLYQCQGKYPIEITAYPRCIGENKKYQVLDDEIVVFTKNVDATLSFYETVGFKRTDDMSLELLPFMEQKKVVLQVKEADTEDVYLDKGGFGSLAFVVDRIEKHKRQLEKDGFFVTDIEPLTVNGKELKICFAANDAGDIVEFIGIR